MLARSLGWGGMGLGINIGGSVRSNTELLSVHFFLERNGQPSPDLSAVLHLKGGDNSLLLSLTEQLLEGVHNHLQADASSYLPGLGCTFTGYFAVQHRFLHWLEILFGIIQSAGSLGALPSQEDPRGKLMLKQLEETPFPDIRTSSRSRPQPAWALNRLIAFSAVRTA